MSNLTHVVAHFQRAKRFSDLSQGYISHPLHSPYAIIFVTFGDKNIEQIVFVTIGERNIEQGNELGENQLINLRQFRYPNVEFLKDAKA